MQATGGATGYTPKNDDDDDDDDDDEDDDEGDDDSSDDEGEEKVKSKKIPTYVELDLPKATGAPPPPPSSGEKPVEYVEVHRDTKKPAIRIQQATLPEAPHLCE